jgi:ADP-ribosylglycohydrolase
MADRCPLKQSDALVTLPINECGQQKCAWWDDTHMCCAVLSIAINTSPDKK